MRLCIFALLALLLWPVSSTAGGRSVPVRFPSEMVDRTASSFVILPDGYETSGIRYPVIYGLHGFGQSAQRVRFDLQEWDRLIESGQMLPVIGVQVDKSGFTDGPLAPYDVHLAREVVPYIDQNYRTIPHREARAITGYSMGGEDSWRAALRHPDVFRLIGTYAMDQSQSFPGMLRRHPQHHHPLEFWDWRGRNDVVVSRIDGLMEQLDDLGFSHTFVEDDGDHDMLGRNPIDNQVYFAQRLWEEATASTAHPLLSVVRHTRARAGMATSINVEVDLTVDGDPPVLSIDGSAIGLGHSLPLPHDGRGRYRTALEAAAPEINGVYHLPVRRAGAEPAVLTALRLDVEPVLDVPLFTDGLDGWTLSGRTDVDSAATEQVHAGTHSLQISSRGGFRLTWAPDTESPALFGYVLRMAVHLGDATGQVFGVEVKGNMGGNYFVDLMKGDNPPLQLQESGWQVVDIPMITDRGSTGDYYGRALSVNERIESILTYGDLSGTFHLDEVRLTPRPVTDDLMPPWSFPPPPARFAGGTEVFKFVEGHLPETIDLSMSAHRPSGSLPPNLRARASFVGPAGTVPLNDGAGGPAATRIPLDPTLTNGVHQVPVLFDGPRGPGLFANVQLQVFPGSDRQILGAGLAPGWRANAGPGLVSDIVEFEERDAMALQASQSWNVALIPDLGVQMFGYRSLSISFHPGDATAAEGRDPRLLVGAVDLLSQIDLSRRQWQTVDIPLESLGYGTDGVLVTVAIRGNLEGTSYLADVRMVAGPQPRATAVVESHQDVTPDAFALEPAYPNPFNSQTVLRFALPNRARVDLSVYNAIGQKVVTLIGDERPAGVYTVRWDGRSRDGQQLASGVYLYQLRAGQRVETRKLLLLR
jgi:hypothetical protein